MLRIFINNSTFSIKNKTKQTSVFLRCVLLFFFNKTLLFLTKTFQRAIGDKKMSATMNDFCEYFAEKLELKKK